MRACPACEHDAVRVLHKYSVTQWPVVECRSCGFTYLGDVPAYDALVEEYAWEKTMKTEAKRRSKQLLYRFDVLTRFRMRLAHWLNNARMNRTLGNGRVLDIGCGGACRIEAGTPYGIEISKQLAEEAQPIFSARGGHVVAAPASEGLDKFDFGFFDAILMRSYLEHESNPRAVLEKAFWRLKPGGIVYIRVPNFGSINRRVMGARWCGFRFPDHVSYFTGRSLRKLTENMGFEYRRTNALSVCDDNLIVELRRPA